MIKKYAVLICLLASAVLLIIATFNYPGGSIVDKNSSGFAWSENFLSNLFSMQAINGSENRGWIWALIGMAFHSVGYGIFFIHMSKKIPSVRWAGILKIIGAANIIFIFLIATPLHDLGTISIVLTLTGLFVITVFILKTKLLLLKFCCIVCLLTYYCFFFLYGFGMLGPAVILQKVYIICSMLLVLGLEYFTRYEDFKPMKPVVQKELAADH
ncbi:hypothetical protein [Pollutibacter soli]|uniref:hypothetical protein n=1 Tax=Pollutibacter soli TaxID=3034157 RepID=UPI0030135D9C